MNDRHLRKRPLVFTTNKPLNQWGKVLHDEDLPVATLDRVLERGRLIRLDGSSGRTRHLNLEDDLLDTPEHDRISGIRRSEFPEPTGVSGRAMLHALIEDREDSVKLADLTQRRLRGKTPEL